MTDGLADLLHGEFGDRFDDLRDQLPVNLDGPNGPFSKLYADRVKAIVVHHTAVPASLTWQQIAAFHVDVRGFAGIGYHIGVRRGRVAYLGDLSSARAHVLGKNDSYAGVCVAGNYETSETNKTDLDLLPRLVGVLDQHFGREMNWLGHRDVTLPGYTVCPGRYLHPHVLQLRRGSASHTDLLHQALRKWADVAQAIQPNDDAALQKAIKRDGYWPISDESGSGGTPAVSGFGLTAQLARASSSAGERIYWWDGSTVYWIDR